MKTLPKYIIKSIKNNNTSLGKHPSFPPDEEDEFLYWALSSSYEEISENTESDNEKDIINELSRLISECKKSELNVKESLEELCSDYIVRLFNIPEDTIDITVRLTDNIDTSNQRLIPEKTKDFTFDSIDDMNYLTDEIYKRRMLNCLICGASMYYSNNVSSYVSELFSINPELPSLYNRIMKINNKLMFIEKDHINGKNTTDAGKVDVYLSTDTEKVKIQAEALLFPILLEETIKGILELAISHGLPNERNKAEYVISKSDFKLAELWDMRIGYSLWRLILNGFEKTNNSIEEVGLNFFFMHIAMLDTDEFNKSLQEIFRGTKMGLHIIDDLCNDIINKKEKDDFDDYISTKSDNNFQINDNEYYSSDELTDDDYYKSFELSDNINR